MKELAHGSTTGEQMKSAMDDAENMTTRKTQAPAQYITKPNLKMRWPTNQNSRHAAFGHRHYSETTHMAYEQNPNNTSIFYQTHGRTTTRG